IRYALPLLPVVDSPREILLCDPSPIERTVCFCLIEIIRPGLCNLSGDKERRQRHKCQQRGSDPIPPPAQAMSAGGDCAAAKAADTEELKRAEAPGKLRTFKSRNHRPQRRRQGCLKEPCSGGYAELGSTFMLKVRRRFQLIVR